MAPRVPLTVDQARTYLGRLGFDSRRYGGRLSEFSYRGPGARVSGVGATNAPAESYFGTTGIPDQNRTFERFTVAQPKLEITRAVDAPAKEVTFAATPSPPRVDLFGPVAPSATSTLAVAPTVGPMLGPQPSEGPIVAAPTFRLEPTFPTARPSYDPTRFAIPAYTPAPAPWTPPSFAPMPAPWSPPSYQPPVAPVTTLSAPGDDPNVWSPPKYRPPVSPMMTLPPPGGEQAPWSPPAYQPPVSPAMTPGDEPSPRAQPPPEDAFAPPEVAPGDEPFATPGGEPPPQVFAPGGFDPRYLAPPRPPKDPFKRCDCHFQLTGCPQPGEQPIDYCVPAPGVPTECPDFAERVFHQNVVPIDVHSVYGRRTLAGDVRRLLSERVRAAVGCACANCKMKG